MIDFLDCEIGYPGLTIFKKLDLSFVPETITAILGPNGCGKSTLVSAVFNPRRVITGEVRVCGKNAHSMSAKALASYVAVVPQIQHIPFNFIVRDVVLMGRNPHIGFSPSAKDIRLVEETLDKLNISHLADKGYARISGGERQMVNIARAVAQDTPVMLMDEPTSYLDLKNQSQVLGLIRRLHEEDGKTIIMTLHDPSSALRFSQQVVFIENGEVLSGVSEKLINPEVIERVYGVAAKRINVDGVEHVVPVL